MTSKFFQFGELMAEYQVPVLNEREARAGAGILFFVAIVAFMNAWLSGDFTPTRMVVIGFFTDFLIRVFVNPKYAPSLVLGRLAVQKQLPEYVGAPQKRFAWLIGFMLAAAMMYLVVYQNVRGPINLFVCLLCLLLLFFETAFGICIGCHIYKLFNKEQAQLCPGSVCEPHERSEIQKISAAQLAVLVVFLGTLFSLGRFVAANPNAIKIQAGDALTIGKAEEERCKVPDFAIAMGHAETWKLHNNCN